MKKKIKTGIPGVDEMTGGGFVEGSVILLSGTPGIGKSNFALQYLTKGVMDYGEPGVYLAIEDKPENYREYSKGFGWDIEQLEKEDKIVFVSQMIDHRSRGHQSPSETLAEVINRISAKRIVLDSVTLFKYLFHDELTRRANLLEFIKNLKESGCTTLIVAEQSESSIDITYTDEHFLADGVIQLFWSRHRDKHERCFRVVKMRGVKINPDIRPMEITDQGVVVYPTQVPLSLTED